MAYVVALAKPNHEAIAARHLQRQGFDYYYPRFEQRKPGKEPTIRPLFPRYMFVRLEPLWRSLNGTRGISYVLMGERGPQVVADELIDAIKLREDKRGLYQLSTPPKFLPGAAVKVDEGPLFGVPLVYEGMASADRVRVLCNMLGRSVVVTLEEKLVKAA